MTLQERLRALTEPCRELDAAIRNKFVGDFAYCDADTGHGCAKFPECSDGHGCGVEWGMSDERTSYPRDWRDDERLPHYTASLDAVVELVERAKLQVMTGQNCKGQPDGGPYRPSQRIL